MPKAEGFLILLALSLLSLLYLCYLCYYLSYLIGLIGILAILFLAYRQSSLRERQQLRIFTGGVILSIAPLLLLTVLPSIFHLTPGAVVGGQFSALSLVVFPLALGFSIL